MMLNSYNIISHSNIAFGTSGARGLAVDFTPEVCSAFTYSFLNIMQKNYTFKKVGLAIDNRPSSYSIAMACAHAIINMGYEPLYYGVIPTPALALKSMVDNIPCIMITGSHIPFDRNGLKFYRPDGEITKEDEKNILNFDVKFFSTNNLPTLPILHDAANDYINRYISLFSPNLLKGKKIGIYEHSSAGRDLYKIIFEKLGATVISLGRSDIFVPIDTEAIADSDKKKAAEWSSSYNLDAIFSTDGDGDRPLIADENGEWLRGDILGILCAKALDINALAVPISCNTAIEKCNYFNHVERTKIGSPYVINAFASLSNKYSSFAGFEANGGFLLGSDVNVNGIILKSLPTRDALLPAIMVLANSNKKELSSLVKDLPTRYTYSDRLQNYPIALSNKLLTKALDDPNWFLTSLNLKERALNLNSIDGVRIVLDSGEIIHFRPSGNAPELRCYAEADSEEKAHFIVNHALKHVLNIDI